MMKTIKTFLMITFIFSLFSCVNDISDNTENSSASTPSADGKTYIVVSLDSDSISRTILPASGDSYKNNLTDITLKGKISGSDDNPVTLAHSVTYAKFSGRIPIAAGTWDFTITAEIDGVLFTANKTQTIESNKLNYLGFTLQVDNTVNYGGLKITTNFTGDANKVVVKLLDQDKQSISTIPDQEIVDFESSGSNYSFTYERPISDNTKRLESGTYYIIFTFFKVDDNDASIVTPLNTYRSYVRIAKGLTTTATITLDLDEVYTITYNYWYNETSEFTADELEGLTFSGGTILPELYSRRSEDYILPTPSLTGYTFDHWELDGQTITQITKGTTGDLEIDAFFTNNGNASIIAPSDTDFVTITDAAYYDISGMENNPVGPNDEYVFPKMKVLKREVTQAEYESFMTYETGFAPSEDEDAKATTSAYYVSWAEALIYCNLLSIHQGLEPVYQMRLNLDGTNKLYTDPADWVQDENTGIRTSNGKYYLDPSGVDANEYGEQTYWQQDFNDGAHIVYNNAANGYRLPLVNEWAYITNLAQASTISGMTDNTKNVYEWCSGCNYNYDLSQSYVTQNMGLSWTDSYTSTDTKPYVHEGMSNLGFRIIRYTLQDDFVNVEGQTNHEVYDGDYDTLQLNSINSGDTYTIKNLLVQKQEVSQSDYELFMKYTSSYEPAESGEAKKTTPAYYVSWAEAVIYCNMLSLAHDLTPVYGIKWVDGSTLTNHTDPKDWATKTDTGVTISDSKYSVTDNNSDAQKAYWIPDYKGESYYFHIDNTANGYRLPTKTEWAYISDKVKNASAGSQLTNIGDNSSKNVNEWCLAFDNTGSGENYCYSTSEMGIAEFSTNNIFSTANDSYDQNHDSGTYVRITSHIGTSNIGFRVVRNAQ